MPIVPVGSSGTRGCRLTCSDSIRSGSVEMAGKVGGAAFGWITFGPGSGSVRPVRATSLAGRGQHDQATIARAASSKAPASIASRRGR